MSNLKKIIKLANKTGDKIIIYNPANPCETSVLMSLENYEKMLECNCNSSKNLTSREMIDKINQDISVWKNKENDFLKDDLYNEDEFDCDCDCGEDEDDFACDCCEDEDDFACDCCEDEDYFNPKQNKNISF